MDQDLLRGTLIRLRAVEPRNLAEAIAQWNQDSEYLRLLDSDACNPASVKKITEWIQTDQEKDPPRFYLFGIHTLEDGRLVGLTDLDSASYPHQDAYVGIGIGDREFWSRGYGTDAMKVVLRFAFQELNLRRVTLNTFEYNPRAIRSYEKAGFVHEGRARGFLHRDGKRWDLIYMGILRDEWLAIDTG